MSFFGGNEPFLQEILNFLVKILKKILICQTGFIFKTKWFIILEKKHSEVKVLIRYGNSNKYPMDKTSDNFFDKNKINYRFKLHPKKGK